MADTSSITISFLWNIFAMSILCVTIINGNTLKQREIHPNDEVFKETEELDRAVAEFLTDHKYSGAMLGVGDPFDRSIIYSQAYGSKKEGSLLNSKSLMQVSSVSKLFTALAVLKLCEENKLKLQDFVFGSNGILSDFTPHPNWDAADRSLTNIKVQDLLYHTSGLQGPEPHINEMQLFRGQKVVNVSQEMGLHGQFKLDDIIRFAMGQPMKSTPGMKYHYSNLGYCILGRLIESVSGMGYEEYVQTKIFTPLGMWKTKLFHRKDLVLTELNKKQENGDAIPLINHEWIMSSPYVKAALGWYSNIPDLLRLMAGISQGLILNKTMIAQMLAPPPPPVSERSQHWHALGLHVGNDGSWWQIGDPHGNELLLYHSNENGHPYRRRPLNFAVILTENNHRNLRADLPPLFERVHRWPKSSDMIYRDCIDESFSSNALILNYGVPVRHFQSFSNVLQTSGYGPTWINVYNKNKKPYVSSIWQRDMMQSIVIAGLTSIQLQSQIKPHQLQGYNITSIVSYIDKKFLRYIAILSQEENTISYGFELTENNYLAVLNHFSSQNIPPTVQCFVSLEDNKFVTYLFRNETCSSWKAYKDLSKEQLELIAKENAYNDRQLIYADSYTYLEELYFSAVFATSQNYGMQLEVGLTKKALKIKSKEMNKRGYYPEVITGYGADTLEFLVLWVKK